DQLLGDAQAAHAGETLSAAPARNDPEIHLWLAKLRGTRRVANVTRQRQLATTAQSEAVDRRDRRLGHCLEQPACLVPQRAPLLGCLDVEAAHVFDVGSCDERLLTRAGEDHYAHRLVGGELA